MSCEHHRGAFVAHLAGSGSPAAEAFGGPAAAATTLLTIFDTARAQARPQQAALRQLAEAKTRLLFTWMQQCGFRPPTHSASGLPKPDAQFGYAALYDTLHALARGTPLPALAVQVAAQHPHRHLHAAQPDATLGQLRCQSCGRFTTRQGHMCPNTASPAAFAQALARRLGLPAHAYDLPALARMLADARTDEVRLTHPLTGEVLWADLDALPLALTQGFVPDDWRGRVTQVVAAGGRSAWVLHAAGLTPVPPPADALAAAASASGTPLPPGTPLVSVLALPTLHGGSAYDLQRFLGTEFRKGKGTGVMVGRRCYIVGERSTDPQDWGHARHTGAAPTPPLRGALAGVAVGRTLVAASEILRTGSVLQRADGIVELYDAEAHLLALYDPTTRCAGDVAGTLNASAAQMAAVLGALADGVHGASGPRDAAIAHDLHALRSGTGSGVALADSGYLALRDLLTHTGVLTLGATVTATRCAHCGRFMGAGGCRRCPAPTEAVTPPLLVSVPPAEAPSELPTPSPPDVLAESSAPLPADPLAAVDQRLVAALDRIVLHLERLGPGAPVVAAPAMSPTAPALPPRPRPDRAVPDPATMTEQERIVAPLQLPRPDPTLRALDPRLLPHDFRALDEAIPSINPDYALNEATRLVLQRIVRTRAAGIALGRVNQTRAFGVYGPPGTGKNEVARQLAAALITVDSDGQPRQGVHFEQVEFDRDMDLGALLGTTALEQGSTVARLGPIGLAAVQGSVICLNEVVRNPKALTAFQSLLEEGELRLKTPEAGLVTIPIHPATTFVLTWNPGLEGDADRPAEAPRSRIVSLELPPPTTAEQGQRVQAFFASAPPELRPSAAEVEAAVAFTALIAQGIGRSDMQQRGRGARALPGPRDLIQFVLAGKTSDWSSALKLYEVFCDQHPDDHARDRAFLHEQFALIYGADGQAVARRAAGAGPPRT